ncbi:MAG: phosphomannomutase [Candidatus Moranbacteria bacterium]|nr:phosphomannomutase [Candidatus Moranbacteria bacterium]
MINPYIFRGYDIRGKVGKDLNFKVVKRIAQGYAYFLNTRRIKQAVVGHDCRLSSEEFKNAMIEGLTESGIDVVDLGMCLTQMVYFAQYHYKTNGGVMITASHNPADYNGMKMALGYSYTLGTREILDLKKIVQENKRVKKAKKGSVTTGKDLKEAYFRDILKRVNIDKKFKIVFDPSCGTAAGFIKELFQEKLGFEIICQNCKVDGSFPKGTPDPTEEHILERLGEKVIETKADLGIAYDGDGDRLGVVDEKGGIIWADVLVAIFADDILDYLPGGKIVYNVLCSKLVDDVINKKGIALMYKTGHSFIKEKVSNERALFGGELSGHFFFMDNFFGHDDAFFATLRLLEYLQRKDRSLSKIIEKFPKYISSPEIKVGCPDNLKVKLVDDKITKELKQKFPYAKHTTIDGIRIDFKTSMLVIRYSHNGPYLTVKFEAKDQKQYEKLKKQVKEILEKHKEINWQEGSNVESLN